MEVQKDIQQMLDLNPRAAFCVREGVIAAVNPAARARMIPVGNPIAPMLLTGSEDYAALREGVLSLQLELSPGHCGACVLRTEEYDVFVLEPETDDPALSALALAARELRRPLSGLMLTADDFSKNVPGAAPEMQAQLARMNRSLHQLLRIVGNMSDAGSTVSCPETRNVTALFEEIFRKAQTLAEAAGRTLTFDVPDKDIFSLVDGDQLERAALNILSNAMKFSPVSSPIRCHLELRGRQLRLSVANAGSEMALAVRATLFSRYQRPCGLEDSRQGLGLGMVLIRAAAAAHGGTVLVDQPGENQTRVTLTFPLRQSKESAMRSPVFRVDYAGEKDRGLLELSDCLPEELYR